jgi:hypothetical protein
VPSQDRGLLWVRGDLLEATSLRNAWTQIDESPRAGLVMPLTGRELEVLELLPPASPTRRSPTTW